MVSFVQPGSPLPFYWRCPGNASFFRNHSFFYFLAFANVAATINGNTTVASA